MSAKEPLFQQKSPVSQHKSPICRSKSPVCWQNSPISQPKRPTSRSKSTFNLGQNLGSLIEILGYFCRDIGLFCLDIRLAKSVARQSSQGADGLLTLFSRPIQCAVVWILVTQPRRNKTGGYTRFGLSFEGFFYIHACTQTNTHTNTHSHARTHTHTHTRAQITRWWLVFFSSAHTHTYTHSHTQIYTHRYTHVYIYTHTWIMRGLLSLCAASRMWARHRSVVIVPQFIRSTLIYKWFMSIKIEICGPWPRCLFLKKKLFVYFSGSHQNCTIALREKTSLQPSNTVYFNK